MTQPTETDETGEASFPQFTHIRWDEYDQPSVAIVETIASMAGRDSLSLPPLHRSLDTDALDVLLDTDEPLTLTFEYDAFLVTISSDGAMVVTNRSSVRTGIDSFGAQLRALFRRGGLNGLPVDGCYEIRNGDGLPDWEVTVTELQKPSVEKTD